MNNDINKMFEKIEEKRKVNDFSFFYDLLYVIYNNYEILNNENEDMNNYIKNYLFKLLYIENLDNFDKTEKMCYNKNKEINYRNIRNEDFYNVIKLIPSHIQILILNENNKQNYFRR